MSSQQLLDRLSYGFSGKAQFGLFGGSARASFAKTVQTSQRSINLVFSTRAITDTNLLDVARLSWITPKSDSAFRTKCGDSYVHEIRRGAELFIMMQMDFASQAEKTAFETAFGASYLTASAEGELKKISQSFSNRAKLSVRAFQRGGQPLLLNQAVGGSNGTAAVSCVLESPGECKNFLSGALRSSSSRTSERVAMTLPPMLSSESASLPRTSAPQAAPPGASRSAGTRYSASPALPSAELAYGSSAIRAARMTRP